MQFLATLLSIVALTVAKNILLTNDDGWAATEIRAFYRDLKAAGHNVLLVAPVSQRSGWGGKFDFPDSPELKTDGEFAYRVKGDPSFDHEIDDMNVWYFNGTPASCVGFGLDYLIPRYFDNMTIDLVVSGPNQGNNLGSGVYTTSGTVGACYNAVYRGVSAVAFSGAESNNSFFKDSLDEDPLSEFNINAKLGTQIVQQLFEKQGANPNVLPAGVGLNVNFPKVGYSSKGESCVDPKFVYTRMNGQDAYGLKLAYNETTGAFSYGLKTSNALGACYSGICDLPSETHLLATGECAVAISAFQIDYDAAAFLQEEVRTLLEPLF